MSVGINIDFLTRVEDALKDTLTVSLMEKVMEAVRTVLPGYVIEQKQTEVCDGGKDDMLDAYISAKRVEGRSEKTLKRYRYLMAKLISACGLPVERINVQNIREYLSKEKERGVSDRTLDGERTVFCSCFGWLAKEEFIAKNPCTNLNKIRFQKKVMLPFSQTDIELIKENAKTIRDKTIVCFLLSTGARINEVCSLNRDDIDFQNMECTVLGKGNKERTVYLDTVTAMLLKRYFDSRTDTCPALFAGKRNERLTPDGVRRLLKVIEKNSGVENVHPHRFRRTLATRLIDHGMNITEMAAILGHESLNVTSRYVYVEKQNVKNNYHRYA